jgi:nitrate reductase NapD
MLEEMHIAGLVVHSMPERMQRVSDAIIAIPGARVHGTSAAGKLVVTLEASSAREMTAKVTRIQFSDGVLSAALVYQYADTVRAMSEAI